MAVSSLFSLSALAALVPASLFALRPGASRGAVYWALLGVAIAGPVAWAVAQTAGEWRTGFSVALWVTVAATMALFAMLAAFDRQAWRLTPLLLPYLFLLGIVAMVWQQAPARPLAGGGAQEAWLGVHIAVSVLTYALVTVAATAGFAGVLQERALKTRRPTALTRLLPSLADGERLQFRLLAASCVVLGLGLASGMATLYLETGALFAFDHKSLLSVAAFVVIAGLLLAHAKTGVRGRRAARLLLLAYLLITLAYPGVKFVTDVLLA